MKNGDNATYLGGEKKRPKTVTGHQGKLEGLCLAKGGGPDIPDQVGRSGS